MSMKVDLHIEKLVLRGLNPAHRYRIRSAIEAELGRLLAEQGPPEGWQGHLDLRLPGGKFHVPQDAKASAIGSAVARQLHGRWTGGGKPDPGRDSPGGSQGHE